MKLCSAHVDFDVVSYRSRFETRTPWVPLNHSTLHESVSQFLTTMSLVFGVWYIGWRWTSSLNPDALLFAIALAVAETGAFLGLVLYAVNLWTARSPEPGPLPQRISDCAPDAEEPDRPLAVDFFFATYSEDPELVRRGIRDARAVHYPHPIDIKIHVLDDGKREEMAAVAREEGVNYITRIGNVGFKAGNLRNAMEATSGDFIVICDADTRPFPNFLVETLGYFREPKMAWVQTPQWFCDIPPGRPLPHVLKRWTGKIGERFGRAMEAVIGPVRIGEDPFANDPQMFYDIIQRRRNWANASFCCGAASIHRREAIMETALRHWSTRIGDLAKMQAKATRRLTGEAALDPSLLQSIRWQGALNEEFTPYRFHVSEDIYTSILLHEDRERGWKSVMHPVPVSRMLSPNDLLSWTIQRFKYAGGTLDIAFHDNPLWRRGLSLPQRFMYGMTFYSYISQIWNVIFLAAPVIFLMTGVAPLAGYSLDFYLHIIPFLLMNELAQLSSAWGISNSKGRAWFLSTFPLSIRALWTVARGKTISFPVTPKDRQTGTFPGLVRWQIGVVMATAVALIWGWISYGAGTPGYTTGAMIANTLWGLNNIFAMLPIIRAAYWRPDPDYDEPVLAEAMK